MINTVKVAISDVIHSGKALRAAAANPDDIETLQKALIQLAISIAKIVIPIILLIVGVPWAIAIIQPYIPYIVGAAVLYYTFAPKTEQPVNPEDNAKQHYHTVRDFLYQPLCDLSPYLPIKKPQSLEDIEHTPEVETAGNGYVLIYRLTKTRSDTTDGDTLAFAQKILRANIVQRLNQQESMYNDGSTYVDNARTINVMSIRDHGTHYQVRIVFVYNKATYDLAKSCSRADCTPIYAPTITRKDVDF